MQGRLQQVGDLKIGRTDGDGGKLAKRWTIESRRQQIARRVDDIGWGGLADVPQRDDVAHGRQGGLLVHDQLRLARALW